MLYIYSKFKFLCILSFANNCASDVLRILKIHATSLIDMQLIKKTLLLTREASFNITSALIRTFLTASPNDGLASRNT